MKFGPLAMRPPITQALLDAEDTCWFGMQLMEKMPAYARPYVPGAQNSPDITQMSRERYSVMGPFKKVFIDDPRYLKVASHNTNDHKKAELVWHNAWCHKNKKKDQEWNSYVG